MILYMFLAIFSLVVSAIAFLLAILPEFRIIGIILCVLFGLLFVINLFLLCMKNNDYKIKHLFKLGKFNKEYNEFEKLCKGNKKTMRQVRKQQKDYFLRFGELMSDTQSIVIEKNQWNDWIENASKFNYKNAKYMEKLSYLIYTLYDACASGAGLEKFFESVDSYKHFTKIELIEILSKNEFLVNDFKKFMVDIIQEYDEKIKDQLYERYEKEDNKIFFTFEDEIFNNATWLAHNRVLLSSILGVYLHGNINFDMYRLFLSKDYRKVIFIYSNNDKDFRIGQRVWDEYDVNWDILRGDISIFKSADLAYNAIKPQLNDYIEIQI